MPRETTKADADDFAEVWRTAQQRRAEDLSGWVGQLFERRRLKLADDAGLAPKAHPALGSAKA